jgi:S1-C subfamily serine protease
MLIRTSLLLFCAVSLLAVGCASGASSTTDEDGSEGVSGKPPAADEDDPGQLPAGPELQLRADQGGSKASGEEENRPDEGGSEAQVDTGDESDEGEADGDSEGEAEGGQQAADTVTSEELDSFLDRGPSYALTLVEVEPSRADGAFQGFEIVSMAEPANRFVSPHLTKGDVITHINGVRLEKPDDYLAAWKQLDEVSTIRVDFIRDGASEHATWQVQ